MGIITLPPRRYKCRECGSENIEEFSEPPQTSTSGHYEGVRCRSCKHESKHYVQSIWEMETGSGSTYSIDYNKPIEF